MADDSSPIPPAGHAYPHSSAKVEGDAEAIRAVARRLIRTGGADSAAGAELGLRECALLEDPTGETHYLLGLAQFLQQKYGAATANLRIALKAHPHNGDWQAILDRSTRNDLSKIGEGLEPTDPFDNALIARPAAMYLREPVDIKPLPPPRSGLPALYRRVQDAGGFIIGWMLGLILRFESRHGIPSTWTECFALPDGNLRRDLKLGGIRNWMNDHTLQTAYPAGELVAHQPPGQKRPSWTTRFRTANGMWTTDDPAEGAAGTRFQWQGVTAMAATPHVRDDFPTTPDEVDPAKFDLVVLGMQEAQYGSPGVRELMPRIAEARVPCLAIMNMPPLPYLKRLPVLKTEMLEPCYADPRVWDAFDPKLIKVDAAYIAREAASRTPQIAACARGIEVLSAEVMELIRGVPVTDMLFEEP
jgi:hypothetical protein